MHQHKYDDTGLVSSYLLLAVLIPLVLYLCYTMLLGGRRRRCPCSLCKKQETSRPYGQLVVASLLCLLLAIAIKNVLSTQLTEKKGAFDPLILLGISENASSKEVKKAYRSKMRKLHVKGRKSASSKEEINDKMTQLNMALKVLSSPKAYKEWQSEVVEKKTVIALPEFIMQFGKQSIGLYLALVGLAFPALFWWSWRRIRDRCPTGACFDSVESFYEQRESFQGEHSLVPQLILFMSKTKEFRSRQWARNLAELKGQIEGEFGFPVLSDSPGFMHIASYLCRIKTGNPRDTEYVLKSALGLIEAWAGVAQVLGKTKLHEAICVLRKMFVQAVPFMDYFMLQFPGITVEMAWEEAKKGGPGIRLGQESDKSILRMKEAVDGLRSNSDALCVVNRLPRMEIEELKAYVLNTEETGVDIFEATEKIIKEDDKGFHLDRKAASKIFFTLLCKGGSEPCHFPFGSGIRMPSWTVCINYNGVIQEQAFRLEGFAGRRRFHFPLTPGGVVGKVAVQVISNDYFGIDIEKTILIKYC